MSPCPPTSLNDRLLCCRLVYRRAKLAAMLNEEDAAYTRELQDLEETPEMRRDRLKSRARELVRRREKEKREFANLMRERQVRALSFSLFLRCRKQHRGTALLRAAAITEAAPIHRNVDSAEEPGDAASPVASPDSLTLTLTLPSPPAV